MTAKNKSISLIPGGHHTDQRGTLIFFNDFDMSEVRRFYIIEHPDTDIIRAWQGHRREQKWFHATAGGFQMAVIQPNDWKQPSGDLAPEVFILSAGRPTVLHIPGGYATGFRALEENSKMIIFSDATVEESQRDDYRFDTNLCPGVWSSEV